MSITLVRSGWSAADINEWLTIDRKASLLTCGTSSINIADIEEQDLATWLYSQLHARNSHLFEDGQSPVVDALFTEAITSAFDDPEILIACDLRPDIPVQAGKTVVEIHRLAVIADSGDIVSRDGTLFVRLPAFRPNLTPGFFMLIQDGQTEPMLQSEVVTRHYVPFADPGAAVNFWKSVIPILLSQDLAFRAKILSQKSSYPRSDAMVFYSSRDSTAVEEVLRAHVLGLEIGQPGSYYCDQLEPSLFRSSSPLPKEGRPEQSFGEHRSRAMAAAIQEYLLDAEQGFLPILIKALKSEDIDPNNISQHVVLDEKGQLRK